MKHKLLLLCFVALLAGCNQGEVLIDNEENQPETPRRIAFETFVDKSTRATGTNSTALNDFYTVFKVYGWKVVGSDTSCVFDNIAVEYFGTDTAGLEVYTAGKPSDEWNFTANSWYYENQRYWDKMASKYQFSAYAPISASADVACNAEGLITIGSSTTPVTVDSKNLMATPDTVLAFTGFDQDYMTAQSNDKVGQVAFTFNHLQAKLNIRILLDKEVTTAQDVSVQKIQVHNLGDKGYYSNQAAAPAVNGWTLSTPSADYVPKVETAYSLNAATNYHNHYLLEQLILPQSIKKASGETLSIDEYSEACIYVEYTIGTETFKSYSPLANIFIASGAEDSYHFEAGKQYTLNITIGPKPISFTTSVAAWATAIDGNHNID